MGPTSEAKPITPGGAPTAGQRMGTRLALVLLAILLALGALILIQSLRDAQRTMNKRNVGATAPSEPDVVALLVAGIPQPLLANQAIPIIQDVTGTIAIGRSTSDRRYARDFTLYLAHENGNTGALDNAAVQVNGLMRYMDHGSFRVAATPVGGGNYAVTLPFPMPGEWTLEIEVGIPGLPTQTVRLTIDLLE